MRTAIVLFNFVLWSAGGIGVLGAQQSRAGLAVTVTDAAGVRLQGVQVELVGPTDRMGETDLSGQISFASILPGAYRLRFTGDGLTTFEREVSLPAGKILPIDITLTRAPAPPPPPQPVVVQPPPAIPGDPRTLSIVEELDREFVGRQPRLESLLSCSGTLRATMIQLNDPLPDRLYDTADAIYYVVGGEGLVRMNGRETQLDTNDFASVPRGTLHTFERRGSRPLILLAFLAGTPCEEVR